MHFGIVMVYGDVAQFADSALTADPGIDDYSILRTALAKAENAPLLGDNCGEAVFARTLIEEMRNIRNCKYTCMVGRQPPHP